MVGYSGQAIPFGLWDNSDNGTTAVGSHAFVLDS